MKLSEPSSIHATISGKKVIESQLLTTFPVDLVSIVWQGKGLYVQNCLSGASPREGLRSICEFHVISRIGALLSCRIASIFSRLFSQNRLHAVSTVHGRSVFRKGRLSSSLETDQWGFYTYRRYVLLEQVK